MPAWIACSAGHHAPLNENQALTPVFFCCHALREALPCAQLGLGRCSCLTPGAVPNPTRPLPCSDCWAQEPEERPSFDQVVPRLRELHETLRRVVRDARAGRAARSEGGGSAG